MRKRILAILLLPFAAAFAQIDEIGGIATSTLDLTGYSHIGGQAIAGVGGNGLLTDLVAYWSMDESSGLRADSTVNAFNLTQIGTVSAATGSSGNAAVFNGSVSNYLSKSDEIALRSTGDISGSLKVQFTSVSGTQTIYSKWASTPAKREMILRLSGGALQLIWYASGGSTDVRLTHTATISTSTTYSVQFGRDDTAGEIYLVVDGAKETLSSGSANADTEAARVGSLGGSSDPLDGWVDEFCIHAKVYTAGDITNLQTLTYADFD